MTSLVEALAEVLYAHEFGVDVEDECRCGWYGDGDHAAHVAAALVAAVPSLPVETIAELIGGEVERWYADDLPHAGMGIFEEDGSPVAARAVTPWKEQS